MSSNVKGLTFHRLTSGNRWNGNGFGTSPADYEARFGGEIVATFINERPRVLGRVPVCAGSVRRWRERTVEMVALALANGLIGIVR